MAGEGQKSKKILVVEDDEASSAILVRLLSQMGFSKIIQAENGNVALNKLYLNQVDLVISDWRMPDMDGLEFYKRAKKEKLLGSAPFLMVSAENQKERIAEALKAGVHDYIIKPVDLKILRGKIEKLLNPHG
ncbi:MAG: response regulator [Nitrospinae bacterium CG22_combo_CG10-13_8_21_14_all_47_10]|jgi:two-component system chemotaxis response regulator CheY|nr:MAG: response regulator [Nitrospinae bacterium CG22_combo_CG10-13_8_21_14_all_47_10]